MLVNTLAQHLNRTKRNYAIYLLTMTPEKVFLKRYQQHQNWLLLNKCV